MKVIRKKSNGSVYIGLDANKAPMFRLYPTKVDIIDNAMIYNSEIAIEICAILSIVTGEELYTDCIDSEDDEIDIPNYKLGADGMAMKYELED
jgi:hypothetical protein